MHYQRALALNPRSPWAKTGLGALKAYLSPTPELIAAATTMLDGVALDPVQLEGLTSDELRITRNGVFARYGIDTHDDGINLFYYGPAAHARFDRELVIDPNATRRLLRSVDSQNVKLLRRLERAAKIAGARTGDEDDFDEGVEAVPSGPDRYREIDNEQESDAVVVANAGSTTVVAGGPRYTFTARDTVYDAVTRLTWQQSVSSEGFTQDEASEYCADLSLAGTGWRLPTQGELMSIVDTTRREPAIDPTAFPGAPSEVFWSSSVGAAGLGRYVYFGSGSAGYNNSSSTNRVRCVR